MTTFKAAIFDWAGTTIDFGSFAPMGAFVKAFAEFGITTTIAEARAPMGAPKRDHIRAMMAMPAIAAQWQARYGAAPGDADIDKLYAIFVPMNEAIVADYATLVPGTKAMVEILRARGMKIGSTTGYTRSIMERVLPRAAAQGYAPDNLICADDLPEGRPGPLGMYQCFVDLVALPARDGGQGGRHRAGHRRGRRRRLPDRGRRALRQFGGPDARGPRRALRARARRAAREGHRNPARGRRRSRDRHGGRPARAARPA